MLLTIGDTVVIEILGTRNNKGTVVVNMSDVIFYLLY